MSLSASRSIGVSCLSVCFVLFGSLNVFNYLAYVLFKIHHGGYTFETHIKGRFDALIGRLPDRFSQSASDIWDQEPVVSFGKVFDEVVGSGSYRIFMDSGFIISVLYIVLGVGLWKLQAWARKGAVYLHLVMIPFHIWLIAVLTEDVWVSLKQNMPDLLGADADMLRQCILYGSYAAIGLCYVFVVAYFYFPKVRRQFQENRS